MNKVKDIIDNLLLFGLKEFNAVKNENQKYKDYINFLEEEKDIEFNKNLKLLEENKSLKEQQIQLNEEVQNLREENEELENTANVQDEYNKLYEEYNNLQNNENNKYNQLLKEK